MRVLRALRHPMTLLALAGAALVAASLALPAPSLGVAAEGMVIARDRLPPTADWPMGRFRLGVTWEGEGVLRAGRILVDADTFVDRPPGSPIRLTHPPGQPEAVALEPSSSRPLLRGLGLLALFVAAFGGYLAVLRRASRRWSRD